MDNRERAGAIDKKQSRRISLETQYENFKAVRVRKWEMLVSSEVKMRGSEKESEQQHKQQNF